MKIIFEDVEIKTIESNGGKVYKIYRDCKTVREIKKIFNKMINKTKTKKLIAAFLVATVLLWPNSYTIAIAQTAPSAPSAPTAPSAPSAPEEPDTTIEEPTAPSAPEAPDTPDAPNDPSTWDEEEESDEEITGDYDEKNGDGEEESDEESSEEENDTQEAGTESELVVALVPVEENETGGQDDGGNVGDTTIDTGDADIEGAIVTEANTNVSVIEDDFVDGIEIANTGNGTDSDNGAFVVIDDTDDTIQLNDAVVTNEMGLGAVTGDNESSNNVGDTTINTGDANTTGTIVNAVNTNIDGIMVNEFNIVEDHLGDYILDFSTGCVSGCAGGVSVENDANGDGSENSGNVEITDTDNTFQTNDATLVNDMVLYSDTGDNETDRNTAGDSTITTGDANVNANILNFANNNLAGDVIYAVVNIFGDLIGDIILPDESLLGFDSDVAIANTNNGSESINVGEVSEINTDNISQFNAVDIDNNLVIDANTGDNETSDNTGGTNSIETGDVDVLAQVVNVANMNLVGGNWWLVIVNEAGNWIGKIIGFDDGASMAASSGLEFIVDGTGEIAVINSDNGSGSENTGNVSSENTDNIVQVNNATIVNNVDLSANTGGNSASKNTAGDSSITTGDANVVANIVNFVNNNIVGSGRLFVTMVNVFGSWFGDFVGPGYEKEADVNSGVGGMMADGATASDTGASGSGTNSSDSSGGSSSGSESSGQSESSEVSAEILIASSGAGNQGILGLFINDGNTGSGGSDSGDTSDGSNVAGMDTDDVMGKKIVNVNLAWFVLIVPLAGLLMLAKKRFAFLRLLPSKNLGNA